MFQICSSTPSSRISCLLQTSHQFNVPLELSPHSEVTAEKFPFCKCQCSCIIKEPPKQMVWVKVKRFFFLPVQQHYSDYSSLLAVSVSNFCKHVIYKRIKIPFTVICSPQKEARVIQYQNQEEKPCKEFSVLSFALFQDPGG